MPLWRWDMWTAGYFVLLVLVVARAVAGREATRVSVRFVFGLTAFWAAAALVDALLRGRSISVFGLAWMAVVAVAAWRLRGDALVFGEEGARTAETAAECGRRLCLAGERTAAGYRFILPGGALDVRLRAVALRVTWISQRAVPPHRKAELFAQLLKKRYRGPLPAIQIRMNEASAE